MTEIPNVTMPPFLTSVLRFYILKMLSLEKEISSDTIRNRIRSVVNVSKTEVTDERWYMRNDGLIDYGQSLGRRNRITDKGTKLLSEIEALLYPTITGKPSMSVLDNFKTYLKDWDNWRLNQPSNQNVYLDDPDYVFELHDEEPWLDIGTQWWGYHQGKKQNVSRTRFVCKHREVYSALMLSYENEAFEIPFPDRETVLDPRNNPHEFDIDHFCDIWYFDTTSLDYSLLYFLRGGQGLTSPLRSHIKPGLVTLPILFLHGDDELDEFYQLAMLKLDQFPSYRKEKMKNKTPSTQNEKDRLHERLFSEWVLDIWQSRQ